MPKNIMLNGRWRRRYMVSGKKHESANNQVLGNGAAISSLAAIYDKSNARALPIHAII